MIRFCFDCQKGILIKSDNYLYVLNEKIFNSNHLGHTIQTISNYDYARIKELQKKEFEKIEKIRLRKIGDDNNLFKPQNSTLEPLEPSKRLLPQKLQKKFDVKKELAL